jgi:DNA-binding transcriptional LysR family regulator
MQRTQRIDRRLNPRDLHLFTVVAEHGNISKAADTLAVSRPAISRTIAGLERALGVPLFDRSPQGVEPTLYSRALRRLAVTVFDDLAAAMGAAVRVVEYAVFPPEFVNRLTPAHRIDLSKHVTEIAKQQSRYSVRHDLSPLAADLTLRSPVSWSRLSEQLFRVDKWSVCRG